MFKAKCPSCGCLIEIDETGFAAGDVLEVNCPMCDTSIDVQVPDNALVVVDDEVLAPETHSEPIVAQPIGQDEQILQMQMELERLKAQTAAATAIAAQATAKAAEVQNRQSTTTPHAAYSAPAKVEGKDKVTAVLLAFFLGGFGAHKFYLGQTGMGILYLIFCWTYIPSFLAFVEGIIYACTDSAEFARKYPK